MKKQNTAALALNTQSHLRKIAKPEPRQIHAEVPGYAELFTAYNDLLCDAISMLARLEVTQKPITTEEYQKVSETLANLRRDLHDAA